ncbi:hypothetical protein Agub_g13877 [Astrephomene gubernaculifera]|uniref:Exonuclease 1 n=1 Tax=Astrephomene gubernaculifera TaxID=47775 RepID=A0AAD3HSG3_9CHLO|nr:hypothetical protein Agub_g13877 [Astrephomene gubernaculifera]
MGINGLLQQLKSISRPTHVSSYRGHKVAIDGYSWLHKGAYSCSRELCEGVWTDGYVRYFVSRVEMLLGNGVIPVVVFDGCRLPMKADEEDSRRRNRREALERARSHAESGNMAAATECYQRAVDIAPWMAKVVMEALRERGVLCLVAPYEADAQMSYLALRGDVHAVLTEDSDMLAYGCPRVLYKLDRSGSGEEILLADLPLVRELNMTGFDHEMLLQMCIFAGCDFLPNLSGVGIKKAHAMMRKHRDFVKAVRFLRFNGTSLPPGYEVRFQRTIWLFRHQRVFCPHDRVMTHLRPLPPGGLGGADVQVLAALPPEGPELQELPFLGPPMEQGVAAGIAAGDLDPNTLQPFDLVAIYRGCRYPPRHLHALLHLPPAPPSSQHQQQQQPSQQQQQPRRGTSSGSGSGTALEGGGSQRRIPWAPASAAPGGTGGGGSHHHGPPRQHSQPGGGLLPQQQHPFGRHAGRPPVAPPRDAATNGIRKYFFQPDPAASQPYKRPGTATQGAAVVTLSGAAVQCVEAGARRGRSSSCSQGGEGGVGTLGEGEATEDGDGVSAGMAAALRFFAVSESQGALSAGAGVGEDEQRPEGAGDDGEPDEFMPPSSKRRRRDVGGIAGAGTAAAAAGGGGGGGGSASLFSQFRRGNAPARSHGAAGTNGAGRVADRNPSVAAGGDADTFCGASLGQGAAEGGGGGTGSQAGSQGLLRGWLSGAASDHEGPGSQAAAGTASQFNSQYDSQLDSQLTAGCEAAAGWGLRGGGGGRGGGRSRAPAHLAMEALFSQPSDSCPLSQQPLCGGGGGGGGSSTSWGLPPGPPSAHVPSRRQVMGALAAAQSWRQAGSCAGTAAGGTGGGAALGLLASGDGSQRPYNSLSMVHSLEEGEDATSLATREHEHGLGAAVSGPAASAAAGRAGVGLAGRPCGLGGNSTGTRGRLLPPQFSIYDLGVEAEGEQADGAASDLLGSMQPCGPDAVLTVGVSAVLGSPHHRAGSGPRRYLVGAGARGMDAAGDIADGEGGGEEEEEEVTSPFKGPQRQPRQQPVLGLRRRRNSGEQQQQQQPVPAPASVSHMSRLLHPSARRLLGGGDPMGAALEGGSGGKGQGACQSHQVLRQQQQQQEEEEQQEQALLRALGDDAGGGCEGAGTRLFCSPGTRPRGSPPADVGDLDDVSGWQEPPSPSGELFGSRRGRAGKGGVGCEAGRLGELDAGTGGGMGDDGNDNGDDDDPEASNFMRALERQDANSRRESLLAGLGLQQQQLQDEQEQQGRQQQQQQQQRRLQRAEGVLHGEGSGDSGGARTHRTLQKSRPRRSNDGFPAGRDENNGVASCLFPELHDTHGDYMATGLVEGAGEGNAVGLRRARTSAATVAARLAAAAAAAAKSPGGDGSGGGAVAAIAALRRTSPIGGLGQQAPHEQRCYGADAGEDRGGMQVVTDTAGAQQEEEERRPQPAEADRHGAEANVGGAGEAAAHRSMEGEEEGDEDVEIIADVAADGTAAHDDPLQSLRHMAGFARMAKQALTRVEHNLFPVPPSTTPPPPQQPQARQQQLLLSQQPRRHSSGTPAGLRGGYSAPGAPPATAPKPLADFAFVRSAPKRRSAVGRASLGAATQRELGYRPNVFVQGGLDTLHDSGLSPLPQQQPQLFAQGTPGQAGMQGVANNDSAGIDNDEDDDVEIVEVAARAVGCVGRGVGGGSGGGGVLAGGLASQQRRGGGGGGAARQALAEVDLRRPFQPPRRTGGSGTTGVGGVGVRGAGLGKGKGKGLELQQQRITDLRNFAFAGSK